MAEKTPTKHKSESVVQQRVAQNLLLPSTI